MHRLLIVLGVPALVLTRDRSVIVLTAIAYFLAVPLIDVMLLRRVPRAAY